ncbi:MAG: AMMECR1 domain-containing protein [Candidatus Peribacteraceae bacterium]|nr:AMMECR1 domain-containing protein [Candidatus Peribacteraceae bacterium]
MHKPNITVGCVLPVCALVLCSLTYGLFRNSDAAAAALDPRHLTRQQMRLIADRAYDALDRQFTTIDGEELADLSFTTRHNRVYITVMRGSEVRCCQSGTMRESNDRLDSHLDDAAKECARDDRFGDGKLNADEMDDAYITVSFLMNRRPGSKILSRLKQEFEPGVHGISIERNGRSVYYKESVPIHGNYSVEKTLQQICKKGKLAKNCYEDPETNISLYDAFSFLAGRSGPVTVFERENIPLEIADISSHMLRERLNLAEQWFLATTGTGGLLRYRYSPSRDTYSSDNNELRQLATLWAMTDLAQFLRSDALTPLIRRSVRHYLDQTICDGTRCHVLPAGEGHIAHSAFLLLTLVTLPDYPDAAAWSKKIAASIVEQQRDDGSYKIFFNDNEDTGMDYYPGETMLALMTYHAYSGDTNALASVERAFPFYRSYWRGNRTTAFIPWHSQAALLLYRETRNPEIPPFVFEMNDWLIANHQVSSSPYRDLLGGFRKPIPGCSTSAYLEGLNDAYALAVDTGDSIHQDKYRDAILAATRFLLTTQYTPENSYYLKNPKQAVGGFRTSLTDNTQRIDHTQHAVRALMQLLENDIVQ